MADFLVEIHTEELPPKTLEPLALRFLEEIKTRLQDAALTFDTIHSFATPRRLAVLVNNLSKKQPDTQVERKGPALQMAYQQGKPTPATLGFAKSCGTVPEKLLTIKTPQGEWLGFKQKIKGKRTEDLLPLIVETALAALPIPKRMRWGNETVLFARPVHSVLMLFDKKTLPAVILGLKAQNKTRGHRFMSKGWLRITEPAAYQSTLAKAFVIADFKERQEKIRQEAEKAVKHIPGAKLMLSDALLAEVTGLVEWPVAISGSFDQDFLKVPDEVLISAMQDHQRYFPVTDNQGKLLPYFIAIVNLESKNEKQVIAGNERVLRARLKDAAFFFETDKKLSLSNRVPLLKKRIFQQKLGSVYDKTERLSNLITLMTTPLARPMLPNIEVLSTADPRMLQLGLLSKADLTTQLVGEFPELQGIAGFYYAKYEGIPEEIAIAIKEHYLPRYSGDVLPTSGLGIVLALADRLDTLVGHFGINQSPTGDKDPFGLRRLAIGIVRILIEKKLEFDLKILLKDAHNCFKIPLENKNVENDVLNFILERLKPWYQEQGIPLDIFASVAALNITNLYDFDQRIKAVLAFKKMSEAEALSVANKRVSNILGKFEKTELTFNPDLYENAAEKNLADKVKALEITIQDLSKNAEYTDILKELADLREPVDTFFDKVLVMTDDQALRENRLLLLAKLRGLFLNVADIALLQS